MRPFLVAPSLGCFDLNTFGQILLVMVFSVYFWWAFDRGTGGECDSLTSESSGREAGRLGGTQGGWR